MFQDRQDFDAWFETELGPVRVCAQTRVDRTHLSLDELLIYPAAGPTPGPDRLKLGVPQAVEIFSALRLLAKDAGFDTLTVMRHRARSRRFGHPVTHTRSLR